MSLDKLDYILAIAEEQTLTRAAKKLYVSQPALTNYINKLEDELGVKLFDRSVTPVQVTRAGSIYIEKMKKIQCESNILKDELRQMGREQIVINIGIGSTRGSHWLPLIIPKFCQQYPNITIQLFERGEDFLENGVLTGDIDVAFGVLNTNYPELQYDEIAEEKIYLAIPRTYECVSNLEKWQATPQNPYYINANNIGNIPFLLPYPGNGFYRCANLLLEQANLTPGRIISYGNMNTAYQLAGVGIGALFITPAFFNLRYPDNQEHLAFCSLQNPLYIRRSVAGYRIENKKIKIIKDLVSITKEIVLTELDKVEQRT